jgi:predicted short-subunit dehydrogenase-like oxidoreductase (DUF2520 family)
LLASISIIGAGRLGATLAIAMQRAGLPVTMVASRTYTSAARLAAKIPGCVAVTEEAAANADLVFLTVPDDAIAIVTHGLVWRPGQYVVHCSGATDVAALAHAQSCGAQVGGFHPIQIFADAEQALALLPGTTVGIEGGVELESVLRDVARALEMIPMALPEGVRARYHGGSLFMSSFLLSMFHQSAQIWATFGMTEKQTLDALLPLATGVIHTAQQKGLAASIAGPISRGDANVVRAHVAAFEEIGGAYADFYRQLSMMQLTLAEAAAKLTPEQLDNVRRAINGGDETVGDK